MNGIHDLGGLTVFGPVSAEKDEPVFHEEWQRRIFALNMASLAFLGPETGQAAFCKPTRSYYERWLVSLEALLRRKRLAGD